jgi:hypothetical protein
MPLLRSLYLSAFLLLIACAPRGSFTGAPPGQVVSAEESIFVGTTRTSDTELHAIRHLDPRGP